jgi:hypothetical protein
MTLGCFHAGYKIVTLAKRLEIRFAIEVNRIAILLRDRGLQRGDGVIRVNRLPGWVVRRRTLGKTPGDLDEHLVVRRVALAVLLGDGRGLHMLAAMGQGEHEFQFAAVVRFVLLAKSITMFE